ncbi:DUF998 domain-containing protein [Mycobacterium sp. 141]|uniref:DUF998 domain-containing protein n=1 Tax=Mycobacterium sp. 141 TaxID=1120797 RepID=UPI0003703359|nr:DUF998 domain-containing protein [Mycobacterium sp. 141]
MSRIRNALNHRNFAFIAALTTLLFFIAEWVVSATWRGYYGYRTIGIGALGVPFCGPEGNWPCSRLYPVMNVALVIAGLAVVAVALSWAVRKAVTYPHCILLAAAGVGLGYAGVVTEKQDGPAHSGAMIIFMVLGAVAIFLIGSSSSTELPPKARYFATIAGLVAIVGYFAYLGGSTLSLGQGGVDRLVVYSVFVSLIVLSWFDRSRTGDDTQDSNRPEASVPRHAARIDSADEVTAK